MSKKTFLSVLALAFLCHSNAWPGSLPVAVVYNGSGICDGCSQSLAKVVRRSGYKVQKIYAGDITRERLKGVALFVMPGGDDVDELMEALRPGEAGVIHDFVAQGGNYLGVCLGAYVAAENHLGLFKGRIRAHSRSPEARMEDVMWSGNSRWLYFQDGPEFSLSAEKKSEVWAWYRTGEVAALVQDFEAGHVGLVGPHLEADQSWLDDDNLRDPDGDDSALLVDFIKAINRPNHRIERNTAITMGSRQY